MRLKNIETFVLNSLLRITTGGVFVILASDILLYPEDSLSILIDAVILISALAAYVLRKQYPMVSVLISLGWF